MMEKRSEYKIIIGKSRKKAAEEGVMKRKCR